MRPYASLGCRAYHLGYCCGCLRSHLYNFQMYLHGVGFSKKPLYTTFQSIWTEIITIRGCLFWDLELSRVCTYPQQIDFPWPFGFNGWLYWGRKHFTIYLHSFIHQSCHSTVRPTSLPRFLISYSYSYWQSPCAAGVVWPGWPGQQPINCWSLTTLEHCPL